VAADPGSRAGFWPACVLALFAATAAGQDHAGHHRHRMTLDERGMVMNQNEDVLPRDCAAIGREYRFDVAAGVEFADAFPGTVFAYDTREFDVEPCSLVRVTFRNRDRVRHQWMVHGLPRYLYPGGMFHLEAAGGQTVSGAFIVPGDRRTYLVHCDLTQHMEKGMKAQLKVGGGDGDLWAVPGVSAAFRRDLYLPEDAWWWALMAFGLFPAVGALRRAVSRRGQGKRQRTG